MGWLRIDVSESCESPKFYGLAYWDFMRRYAVCYPIPLNWVVWIGRELWFRIKSTPMGIEEKSYKLGIEKGRKLAEDNFYYSLTRLKLEQAGKNINGKNKNSL